MKRLAILLSGRGSNFFAIADQVADGRIPAEISVVISNRADAPGLEEARRRGLHAVCLPSKGVPREEHDQQVIAVLEQHQPDLICLAGYMRLLGRELIERFAGKILNIHPSLLPSFPGLHAQKQALEYGVTVAGCTVHFVTEELDAGPIILQATVPVFPDDTESSLSSRILDQEHRIYSEAIRQILKGGHRLDGRRVLLPS